MNRQKASFRPGLHSLFSAVAAAALLAGGGASAQTSISASSTLATSTSSATTTTSTDAVVNLTGLVTGGDESVSFSGQAMVNTRVVTDPDFGGTPTVVLTIDLSNVTGVGTSTRRTYVTSNRAVLDRRLTSVDTVQYTFPFSASGASPMSTRVGSASFTLRFDVNSLKLIAAGGSIGSP